MKVVKRVDKQRKYEDKKGKERCSVNYYIVSDNDVWIPVRPVFSKSYTQLDMIAETVING